MSRRILLALVALLLAVGGSVILSKPAMADGLGICSDAPPPIAPKSGLPGMLTSVPANIPDNAPDPFTDTHVSIGSVYGYNWKWANYDLGCGNDFLRDPTAVINTQSANSVLSLDSSVLASTAVIDQLSKAGSISWLSDIVATTASILRDPALKVWLPMALIALGAVVVWRSKKSTYAETMTTLLVVAAAVAMSVFTLLYPAQASNGVDKAVDTVATAAGSQFPTTATDAVTRESMYRTWLAGNFTDPDSSLAQQLGPKLMAATHYTWSDMKRMQSDPSAKKSIDRNKATAFKAIAKQIETESPASYEQFTGRGERTGPALLGFFVVIAMSLFLVIAAVMVLISRVIMQGLTMIVPLAALLGIFPGHRTVLARMWDLFTAALIAVAKFVLAGGVMTLVLGGIESANMNPIAKLFWIIVATVVAIVLTKPVRSMKTIMPGLDPNRSYIKETVGKIASLAAQTAGPALAAEAVISHHDREAPERPVTYRPTVAEDANVARSATQSMPALPAPTRVSTDQPRETVTIIVTEPAPASRAAVEAATEIITIPIHPAPIQRALPAAPLALESASAGRRSDLADPDMPAAPTPPGPAPITPAPNLTTGGRDHYKTAIPLGPGPGAQTADLELADDGSQHEMVTYHAPGRAEH